MHRAKQTFARIGNPAQAPGRGQTRLAGLAFLLLAAAVLLPAPSHAQWITDLETGVFHNSNLGDASAGLDVHAVTGVTGSVTTGPFFEISPGTSVLLTGLARETAFNHYNAENFLALGASARLDHKFGLGRQAPHAYLVGSQTRLEVRDGLRTGWLQALTLGGHELFGDRLVLRAEAIFDRRSGTNPARVHPGVPSNVFDQSHRSIAVGADYSINDVLLVQLTTTVLRGDADYIETSTPTDLFSDAEAVARDPTFGPSTYVEKVPVRALLLDFGASWAFGEHASLNFIYRRELTLSASGSLYARSIPTINYQYRFD
jgi:hypothetical protein